MNSEPTDEPSVYDLGRATALTTGLGPVPEFSTGYTPPSLTDE